MKGSFIIKQVSKREIEILVENKFLRPCSHGYVNRKGNHVGYCKTCPGRSRGKRYIEDWYADKVKTLK